MTGEPKSESIKTKIMLGFSLVICGVLFVGFVAYKSFNLMVGAIDEISKPDTKVILLNNVLRDLAQAEIELRSSTLKANNSDLDDFISYTDTISARLDSLRALTGPQDLESIAMLDTIDFLLGEKFSGTDSFLQMYFNKKNTDYFGQAIKEITSREINLKTDSNSVNDSVEVESINLDSALQAIDSIAGQAPKNQKRGLFRSKKKKTEDSIALARQGAEYRERIGELIGEMNKATEKEVTENLPPAVTTDTVTKIISNIKLQDQREQFAVTSKELSIIENNSRILHQVRALIGKMEKEEREEHQASLDLAGKTANKSILIIIITGIVGTFSGIMFIYVIFNDITKRNFYRKQLDKARKKAIREAKAKEEFLANMSHEIRTPLNAILGFSEQMGSTSLKGNQREYLGAIQSSSSHLLATVNDVLDFSKIQANKLNIEHIPFKLLNVVKEVIGTLKLKAEQKNIALRYDFDDQLNQVLAGDPFRLKQILINLVNNGLKFTDKGFVEIKAGLVNDFKNKLVARIEVNDSGIGIAPDKLETIFEGFSQSDTSTTRKYGGTGLGLTISKRLVELQHGDLSVTSEVNKGSSFIITMTFDKVKDFKPEQKEDSLSIQPSVFKGLKLLVIDDDSLNLQLAKIIFDKWDLAADFVDNGRDAMSLISENYFDLIITDIQMPDLSGMDLARHIRQLEDKKKKNSPILAFTANVMKDDLERYMEAGINDYLLKPFKEIHLYNKIVSMLNLASAKDQNPNNTNSVKTRESSAKTKSFKSEEALFCIDEILQFTGEKNESLLEVLESFVTNSRKSLNNLEAGFIEKDWNKVRMMAHKMLPSFQHLKIEKAIPSLKKLEVYNEKENASARQMIETVLNVGSIAIKQIKKEISEIKKELAIAK